MTSIAWKALCASLLPITFSKLPELTQKLHQYFSRYSRRTRPTAIERCLERWQRELDGDLA